MSQLYRRLPVLFMFLKPPLANFRAQSRFVASDGIMLTEHIDVVMEYAYGRSDHRLEDKEWGPDYHDAVMEAGKQAGILKQMFFIFTFMQSIPEKLAVILSPPFDLVLRIQRVSLSCSPYRSTTLKSNGLKELTYAYSKANRSADRPDQKAASIYLPRFASPHSVPRNPLQQSPRDRQERESAERRSCHRCRRRHPDDQLGSFRCDVPPTCGASNPLETQDRAQVLGSRSAIGCAIHAAKLQIPRRSGPGSHPSQLRRGIPASAHLARQTIALHGPKLEETLGDPARNPRGHDERARAPGPVHLRRPARLPARALDRESGAGSLPSELL